MSWITHCSLHATYNSECGVCIAWALFASDDTPALQEGAADDDR